MKKFAKIVGLIYLGVLAAVMAPAQVISGTVVDTSGVTWTNAVVMAHLNNPSGSKPLNKTTLAPIVTDFSQQGTTGAFSMTMLNTANIIPAGTSWVVSVCPFVSGQNCMVVTTLTQQASNLNISSRIAAVLQPANVNPVEMATAYTDANIISPIPGSCYLLMGGFLRCSASPNLSSNSFVTVNSLPVSILTNTIASPNATMLVMKPQSPGNVQLPDCQLQGLAPTYAYVNLSAFIMTVTAPNGETIGGGGSIPINNWALFQPVSGGSPGCSWQQF